MHKDKLSNSARLDELREKARREAEKHAELRRSMPARTVPGRLPARAGLSASADLGQMCSSKLSSSSAAISDDDLRRDVDSTQRASTGSMPGSDADESHVRWRADGAHGLPPRAAVRRTAKARTEPRSQNDLAAEFEMTPPPSARSSKDEVYFERDLAKEREKRRAAEGAANLRKAPSAVYARYAKLAASNDDHDEVRRVNEHGEQRRPATVA